MNSSNSTARSGVADWLIREWLLHQPVHDEPREGVWACGGCTYFNHGVFCSKCGASMGSARFWQEPVSTSADCSGGVDSLAPKSGTGATANRPAPGHGEVDSQ